MNNDLDWYKQQGYFDNGNFSSEALLEKGPWPHPHLPPSVQLQGYENCWKEEHFCLKTY